MLLDGQRVVMSEVLTKIRARHMGDERSVIIVRGGPGTVVLAIGVNLVANCRRRVCGSARDWPEGIHREPPQDRRPPWAAQFSYFNNFGRIRKQSIDVLICDEAHRTREKSETLHRESGSDRSASNS